MLFSSPLRVYTDVNLQDDRASLAELHEYLNAADAFTASPTTAEAEFDLASNAAVARARRLSVASSIKSERRRSLPARTSRTSLASEYSIAETIISAVGVGVGAGEEDGNAGASTGMGFQQRRRRAAKLAQFFGVDYRELVNDVIASIEGGVAVEERRGTLRADEVEVRIFPSFLRLVLTISPGPANTLAHIAHEAHGALLSDKKLRTTFLTTMTTNDDSGKKI